MTAVLDVSRTPRTPFHRLVLVELRKTYDTRAGFWLLAVIGLIAVLALWGRDPDKTRVAA